MDSVSHPRSTGSLAPTHVSELFALRASIEKAQVEGRLQVSAPGKNGVHGHNYRQKDDGEIYCT